MTNNRYSDVNFSLVLCWCITHYGCVIYCVCFMHCVWIVDCLLLLALAPSINCLVSSAELVVSSINVYLDCLTEQVGTSSIHSGSLPLRVLVFAVGSPLYSAVLSSWWIFLWVMLLMPCLLWFLNWDMMTLFVCQWCDSLAWTLQFLWVLLDLRFYDWV